MQYGRTQYGRWQYLLLAIAAGTLLGSWQARGELAPTASLLVVSGVLIVAALAFATLTITDEGDYLSICYGPLPLFRKRFAYAEMTAVERGRSSVIDGWGIHYTLGRGWTYNLWGFDCVRLRLGKRVVQIGSDDCDNLVRLIQSKMSGQ